MKFDEEIEVLDLEENIETLEKSQEPIKKRKGENKKEVNEEQLPSRSKKRKLKKVFMMQFIFCLISGLFILGCCIFYGARLFKYYRIYNPKPTNGGKVSLISNGISSNSEIVYEDSGLYINGGNYIYKGDISNNYIKFNNMLWRIIRINQDGTIEMVLNDYINLLNWDNNQSDYFESNIYKYLNEYFINSLNKDYLTNLSVCTDKFDELNSLSCNNKKNSYVSLLDVTNFLNSIVDGKTYLAKNDEIIWLSNQGNEKIWHTNGANVSMSEGNNFYAVKPVVMLKATTILYGGKGTLEDPYIIEKNHKIGVGSYVKLNDDLWIVYNNDNNLKLSLASVLDKQYHFSYEDTKYDPSIKDSLAEYLNTTYLDSLGYKDKLLETEWYIGAYTNKYKDVLDDKMKAKVGILNLIDLKFNNELSNYLLATSNEDGLIYNYGDVLKVGKPTIYRNIRPCISIAKNTNFVSGNGSKEEPYFVEVE